MIEQLWQKIKENWVWLVIIIGIPAIIALIIYLYHQSKTEAKEK